MTTDFREAKNMVDTFVSAQWVAKGRAQERAERQNHQANSTEVRAVKSSSSQYRSGWDRIFGEVDGYNENDRASEDHIEGHLTQSGEEDREGTEE